MFKVVSVRLMVPDKGLPKKIPNPNWVAGFMTAVKEPLRHLVETFLSEPIPETRVEIQTSDETQSASALPTTPSKPLMGLRLTEECYVYSPVTRPGKITNIDQCKASFMSTAKQYARVAIPASKHAYLDAQGACSQLSAYPWIDKKQELHVNAFISAFMVTVLAEPEFFNESLSSEPDPRFQKPKPPGTFSAKRLRFAKE